jgi:hypothetical protein
MKMQLISDLLSRKKVKVAIQLLKMLTDGSTPAIARIWTERKGKPDECEHDETCSVVSGFEFVLMLVERTQDGKTAIRSPSPLADGGLADAGVEGEPAVEAEVGDWNQDGNPEVMDRPET